MKTVKKILSILAAIALVCAFTIPFASAATIKVYEKDIFCFVYADIALYFL